MVQHSVVLFHVVDNEDVKVKNVKVKNVKVRL